MPFRLTNSASSQAQNQDCKVANPNIHLIYELLEHVKGSDLKIQNCRIFMAQATTGYAKGVTVRAQYE